MPNGEKIRIRLKAYDHRILDQSTKEIVDNYLFVTPRMGMTLLEAITKASLTPRARCKLLILKLGERGVLACRDADHESLDSFFVIDSFVDQVVDAVGAGFLQRAQE